MSQPPFNGVIFQAFHAHLSNDGTHWELLRSTAPELAAAGFTAVWLPPPTKGCNGINDTGYGVYDRFDLGEFDQCGTRRTKYGTRSQLHAAIEAIQAAGMQVYADCGLSAPGDDPTAIADLKHWGSWFLEATAVDGLRFDVAKQPAAGFYKDWLRHIRPADRSLFAVANYWTEEIARLHQFIQTTEGNCSLFDVPLHYGFHRASRANGYYDMRRIFDGTLMQQQPSLAVTFVENHETQPLQALESVVEPWFKPIAYALILLRQEGYPCVFAADYYGTHYWDKNGWDKECEIWMPRHRWLIDKFLYARQHFAHGKQYDYFDHFNVIGWTCLGDAQHPKAMAVILSDGWGGSKWMEVGKSNTLFYDLTEHLPEPICTNDYGWGEFYCKGGSVSVWVEEEPQ
jgi:alpha-amylase